MTEVLVCGGRKFKNKEYLFGVLDGLHVAFKFTRLIHGDARGADSFADEWAISRDVPVTAFPASWEEHGPVAGPRRNTVMLNEEPQLVVAFPGDVGTADMVKKARRAKIKVLEFPI